jgi:hypothetical protein
VRGVTGAGGDQGGAGAGAAGDAVEAGGFDGVGPRHDRQDGGEPVRQQRLARPGGPSSSTLWSERLHTLLGDSSIQDITVAGLH